MWRIFIVSYRYRAIATSSHAPASPPSSMMKSRRLRLDTGLSLPPAIPTLVWKVPANDGPVRSVYLGASLPRNARQVLETDLDRSVSEAAPLTLRRPYPALASRVVRAAIRS